MQPEVDGLAAGSRRAAPVERLGPDPPPDLLPFSDAWQLTWSGQWALNGWPNAALTVALIALALRMAWKRGYSPVELFSQRADAKVVEALRGRFGMP